MVLAVADSEGENVFWISDGARSPLPRILQVKSKLIKTVSLFCGIGGCDQGLIGDFYFLGKYYPRNPFRVIYANDIDKYVAEVYGLNFGDHIVCGDVAEIDSHEIPDHDFLMGGFPCQPFSMSARPLGDTLGVHDERGGLFFEMERILRDKQPKAFVAENVKGLLSSRGGKDFEIVIGSLKKAGYDVVWDVLNAADFGVPQRRERIFMVGTRRDLQINFKFPIPTHSENPEREKELWVPLKTVIDSIHPEDEKYVFSQKALQGLLKANKQFNKGRGQDLEKPCATISAHLAKVSINGTDPVLRLPTKELAFRRFTPREAAMIQSFPNSYQLFGPDLVQYRQIGNAVPPVLFWHLARSIYFQVFL